MSSELEIIAKDLEPAVAELAQASGILIPVQELAGILADTIRYRWRVPHACRLIANAAEKVRATGLPPRGVPDKLLSAVLENGAVEDDESMQDRWANLLAYQATFGDVPPALPEILKQIAPEEAVALELLATHSRYVPLPDLGLREAQVENLVRLGLIKPDPVRSESGFQGFLASRLPPLFNISPLGTEFIECCRNEQRAPVRTATPDVSRPSPSRPPCNPASRRAPRQSDR